LPDTSARPPETASTFTSLVAAISIAATVPSSMMDELVGSVRADGDDAAILEDAVPPHAERPEAPPVSARPEEGAGASAVSAVARRHRFHRPVGSSR
jgi:hypothetical protein